MSDELDITPDVHFLNSIRADKGSWVTLVAEAVDNSLDASATTVAIQLLKDNVTIADDGCGIVKAHESAIVRLGEHRPNLGTKLGRFGMGIKYNATSAGDLLRVDSTSNDGHMTLQVDWTKVIQGGRWKIPKPVWRPINISRGTGTEIMIGRLCWEGPKEKDVVSAREQLALIFYPAIEHGAVIRLNHHNISLLREPDLVDVVEQTVRLANGKGAHVRAGILTNPERSNLYAVQVSYKHRVILSKSNFGCDNYSGTRRMFARVVLTSDWGLSRFKDDIIDEDRDELETLVEDVLRPILEKCHSAQMELKIEEMTTLLNDMLSPELRATRPRRKRDGEARSGRKPGRHGKSKEDESSNGPARTPKAPNDRLLVTFEGPLSSEHGYGHFVKGRPNRITLATDNPVVAALLAQRDRELAAQSLFGFALFLYEHEKDKPPALFDIKESFGLRVWKSAVRQDAATAASINNK